jgi:lipoprotein-anchoring transpeptidase ErfK/SrfK
MSEPSDRRRRRKFLAALTVLLAAVGLAVAAGVYVPSSSNGGEAEAAAAPDPSRGALPVVPDPVEPAFVPPKPKALAGVRHVSRFSPVRRAVTARAEPDLASRAVAVLAARTPEGTRNIVPVLGRERAPDGSLWLRVRLPVLPNNTVGWVPRDALGGYGAVRTRLVVDLQRLTATLYRSGRPILAADVGVGRAEWPTPRGEFYIRNRLTKYANPFYGPIAFGTSARSDVLTDWPAGGFVGIHGTNRPDLLPGRVSHGCIRLRNEDILRLARLMRVGTPVTIR